MDVHDVGLRIEVKIPHVLEQHGARHDLTGVAHQVFQQAEFARLQQNVLAVARDFAFQPVHLQIAYLEVRSGLLRAGPAHQRFQARHQLGQSVGFGQVVVAAGGQPFDPVVDFAQRAQHQRRRIDLALAQFANDRQAVHPRQHAVDHHDIVAIGLGQMQAVEAVGGVIYDVPALVQTFDEKCGRILVVFDYEYAHCIMSRVVHRPVTPVSSLLECLQHGLESKSYEGVPATYMSI